MALTNRDKAWAIRNDLQEKGYSDQQILRELLVNILSGDEAIRAMDLVAEELGEVEEYTDGEEEPDLFQQMGLTNEKTGLEWECLTTPPNHGS